MNPKASPVPPSVSPSATRAATRTSAFALWWRALRAYSFTATILPVACGWLAAWRVGGAPFAPAAGALTLATALLLHAGVNLLNDYYDFMLGFDAPDAPGSSGLLTQSLAQPAYLLRWGRGYLAAGAAAGVALALWRNPWLLAPGAGGWLGAFFYSHPRGFKYRGWGEPLVFLLMGPMLFASAWVAAGAAPTLRTLAFSLPCGCLVTAILLVNNLRDLEMDRHAGFRTLPARLGMCAAQGLYLALLTAALLLPPLFVLAGWLPRLVLVVLAAAPPAARLGLRVFRARPPFTELARAPEQTAGLYLFFGLLLLFGLAVGRMSPA